VHDKKEKFSFASLQSEVGRKLIAEFSIPVEIDSVILIQNQRAYYKSTAAIYIAQQCSGFWKILGICIVVPKFIRDFIYNIVAKNRYKWFGKKEVCWIPEPNLTRRFME
jgi:predicted DCC family thiol-disulfide oxidoreductase YuxK